MKINKTLWSSLFIVSWFKEEVSRALSKRKVPVAEFGVIVANWKKVLPNIICMLGDNGHDDQDGDDTFSFSEYKNLKY